MDKLENLENIDCLDFIHEQMEEALSSLKFIEDDFIEAINTLDI